MRGVAEDCGRRGVNALVVIAAELSGPARAELLEICRRHGMRMVGPTSFGVANPSIGLVVAVLKRKRREPPAPGMACSSARFRVARSPPGLRHAGGPAVSGC